MLRFTVLDPRCRPEHLGLIPTFLDEKVLLPAWQQIDDNYRHGGGWQSFKKGWNFSLSTLSLKYPGDPPLTPLAYAILHNEETIYIYPHGWVLILQRSLQWDIARID
jgi:hypothetical protein